MAGRQCEAGRGRRGAHRGRGPQRRRGRRSATAARRASACSPPTARGCSTGSAPALPRPAPTSSMRGSTPPATAWRSTICWCSTAAGSRIPTSACASRLIRSVEQALTSVAAAAASAHREQPAAKRRIPGRSFGRGRRPRLDPHDRGRGQCARPARRCWRRLPRPSTRKATASIPRISRRTASARSTSST